GYSCTGSPSTCAIVCGDGRLGDSSVGGAEECDDGNTNNGDGCSASCTRESGFICSGEPSICGPGCEQPSECAGSDDECKTRTCFGEPCGLNFAPLGANCAGGFCDGSGTCIPGCSQPGNCPSLGECATPTCVGMICGRSNMPVGSQCTGGTCDGNGTCIPQP